MKSIMMLETLVRQTVAGVKTETRRTGALGGHAKLPVSDVDGEEIKAKVTINTDPDRWVFNGLAFDGSSVTFTDKYEEDPIQQIDSRLSVGDIIYIKEPWRNDENRGIEYAYLSDAKSSTGKKFNNKMFMPATHARFFLKITGVRIERVFDISVESCYKEGIERDGILWKDYVTKEKFKAAKTPRDSFFSLFKLANGQKSKDEIKDIWVFIYEYEFLKDYNNENKVL